MLPSNFTKETQVNVGDVILRLRILEGKARNDKDARAVKFTTRELIVLADYVKYLEQTKGER